MSETGFSLWFSNGFGIWNALNAIAPFAQAIGFGIAVLLTFILIRALKRAGQ